MTRRDLLKALLVAPLAWLAAKLGVPEAPRLLRGRHAQSIAFGEWPGGENSEAGLAWTRIYDDAVQVQPDGARHPLDEEHTFYAGQVALDPVAVRLYDAYPDGSRERVL